MRKYDIFISYRRDGGEQSAKAIYDTLKERGYNVFLDIETLRSGAFNQKLYSVIEECSDMVVVLSPDSLDRCVNEDDWVRLEIAHALKNGKNVIPVMLRGFSFPENLPGDINEIRFQNGIQASVEFFDAFIEKLCSFLICKPFIISRFKWKFINRRFLITAVICILLVAVIWGAASFLNGGSKETGGYPSTMEEKNTVNGLLGYLQSNVEVLDGIFLKMEDVYKSCEDYLISSSPDSYSILESKIIEAKTEMEKLSNQAETPSQRLLDSLADTSLNIADVEAVSKHSGILVSGYKETLDSLGMFMDPGQIFDNPTRKRILDINQKFMELDKDTVIVGVCRLLAPINKDALKEFRLEFLPGLYTISNSISLWSDDDVTLKGEESNITTQQEKLMNEYSELIGNNNFDMLSEKNELVKLYMDLGFSEEEAKAEVDKYLGKAQSVENAKVELEKAKQQLEAEKQKLREKCTPEETDDPYIVWGKALRLMTAKMYDDAVNVMQFFMIQMKDADPGASVYVPAAINFARQIGNTGIDYGILVVGYDPASPPHEVYKIGDIVVAFNGNPCRNIAEYVDMRNQVPDGSEYKVTLLRADDTGMMKLVDVTIPAGQPKVAFMELTESDE